MSFCIEPLTADGACAHEPELTALLQDAVDGGASVGFLPPLAAAAAAAYWATVAAALREGSRVLLAARDDESIVGTVQLELAMRENARHRAEVSRLLVHRRARRRGIGRALMQAIEERAARLGRTTLVLDTRRGDPSEHLYRSLGWQCAGTIPRYAQSAGGALDPTTIYYKLLG